MAVTRVQRAFAEGSRSQGLLRARSIRWSITRIIVGDWVELRERILD